MPRPTNKKDLLAQGRSRYEALNAFIVGLSPADRDRAFRPGTMNRNIRDVLGHLHHWHTFMLGWYAVGMKGGKPDMPAKGYTWAATPELNRWIHRKYSDIPLKKVRALFERSHADVVALIERHSDAELFTKKRYPWTGSTSLGAYLVGATSSHYDWALKLIKKGMK
ncbi:MAG: ClbS/DfsB family four-helix bundle protein [Flavobacteriales bacterium]|nr:ClbS/DfsB family four-helix bundle protein [Flavobacteriales bacterium]MBK7940914.1 ClbS/DfsB family four-helix bundle protein [Flavobacteriales bacterium]MBK9701663.1 ClbS/DfsB family four-helix bundle protein [Flavobacteriales bacterium]